jgi:hypothetical protein
MDEDLSTRQRIGRAIDRAGQLTLPLGIGAGLGYLAADQEVRLMPTMLGVLLVWAFIGLVAITIGRVLSGKALAHEGRTVRIRRRIVGAIVLAVVALLGRLGVWVAEQPTALTRLTQAEFEAAFILDAERYQTHAGALETIVDRLETADVPRAGGAAVLTPEEEAMLRESWVAMSDVATDLDQLRQFWEDWYRYDPSRVERAEHLRSFLLTYAAELALYEAGARFSQRVLKNSNAVHFLDAPHPEAGLPSGTFSRFREQVLGSRDQARVVAGERYLDTVGKGLHARREAQRMGVGWLFDAVQRHEANIDRVTPIDRATLTVRADTQLLKRSVQRTWFPIQKNTAEWAGDLRVRRIGWYLIDSATIAKVEPLLQPGDILMSRKNWYLSNVGLPGFWPHGLLYTGTPEQFEAYFDDASVAAWLATQPGAPRTLGEHLAATNPVAWGAFLTGHPAVEEHPAEPWKVIEAISEGVSFNTWEHAAGDYLAAMSPRFGKLERARAMVRAFEQYQRPYDFDFDFATDHAVVCTELVWRAWRTEDELPGLDLPLVRVAGRMTLPANELARIYDEQADDPNRELDFVFFIDAHEKDRTVFISDEASYRASWKRTKWDVATN